MPLFVSRRLRRWEGLVYGALRTPDCLRMRPLTPFQERTDADVNELDLLIIADSHFIEAANHECAIPQRKAAMGLELIRRAVAQGAAEGPPDAIVLMGDLADNGDAEGAEADLQAIQAAVPKSVARSYGDVQVPVLVVPGNHDGNPQRMLRIFQDRPGVHRINGYQLITCVDSYAPGGHCTRSRESLECIAHAAKEQPGQPVVVLQHNPIHPPIDDSFPYIPLNAGEAMRIYAESGVLLSVSGHYHPGQPLSSARGVGYLTAPAVCEAPFRFLRVQLRGREITVSERSLTNPRACRLWDCHVHTELAYCRDDEYGVTARGAIERAELFGVDGMVFTEHVSQLYMPQDGFWRAEFMEGRHVVERAHKAGYSRMAEYRALVDPLRSSRVKVGIETECDEEGRLVLLDEDREGLEVVIGSLHFPPKGADLEKYHMKYYETIVPLGIDVLAHPFRLFRRKNLRVPTEQYRPLARLLKAHGVAAEMNFHTNVPDPRFFATCLEEGVKISLASDAHGLWEVAALTQHMNILRQIGVTPENAADVLFTPS